MKMILAGVAFAALLAPPVLAQTQADAGLPSPPIYREPGKQSGIDARDFYLPTRGRSATNPDPTKQWPCDTAPDFCPNYHGDPD